MDADRRDMNRYGKKAEKIWNDIDRQVKWQLIQIYKNDTSRQAGRQEDKYVKDRQYCSSVTKRKYSRIEGAASVDKGVSFLTLKHS